MLKLDGLLGLGDEGVGTLGGGGGLALGKFLGGLAGLVHDLVGLDLGGLELGGGLFGGLLELGGGGLGVLEAGGDLAVAVVHGREGRLDAEEIERGGEDREAHELHGHVSGLDAETLDEVSGTGGGGGFG